MISLDCKPGANTFHVLPYSAGLPAAATAAASYPSQLVLPAAAAAWSPWTASLERILSRMSYPAQLDCQLLQTWEEKLLHLTLRCMISLDCKPGANTFHVLPYSAGLPAAANLRRTAAAPHPTPHDLLGLRAWIEYFPCLTLLSWTASCCLLPASCRILPYSAGTASCCGGPYLLGLHLKLQA